MGHLEELVDGAIEIDKKLANLPAEIVELYKSHREILTEVITQETAKETLRISKL